MTQFSVMADLLSANVDSRSRCRGIGLQSPLDGNMVVDIWSGWFDEVQDHPMAIRHHHQCLVEARRPSPRSLL